MGGSGRASHDAHLSAMKPREDGAPDFVAHEGDETVTCGYRVCLAGLMEREDAEDDCWS